ncbi:MAG: M14 family metallopeptidase [Nitrospinota bacterium]
MTQPNIYKNLPDHFLDCPANRLIDIFNGPSLIHLKGKIDKPIFLATLLHGNEPTGLRAIQKFLKNYFKNGQLETLPQSLILFIGNVQAAQQNLRLLPGQTDFNRIWNGGGSTEHKMAQSVIDYAKKHNTFLSVDIHNTSGKNPHYGCVNLLDSKSVSLAQLFSPTLIYFTEPHEVFSLAFSKFCPSITIEAGKPDDPNGEPHVLDFIKKLFKLKSIPDTFDHEKIKIFHSMARIKIPNGSRIGFHNQCNKTDFCFPEHLDSMNFKEFPANTLLGWRNNPDLNLIVLDENNKNVEENYLDYVGKEIRLKRPVLPSMISTDEKIVLQDCLGYLMEPYPLPKNL